MPKKRIINSGAYYHIYARGIKKEIIFHDFKDYHHFLRRLACYRNDSKDHLILYCVMPNHYHLIIRAKDRKSISKLLQRLGTSYVRYYALKYQHSGHVFQGRFNSKLVDTQEYLLLLSRYIHRNPLDLPEVYENGLKSYYWSSYHKYIDPKLRSIVKLETECIMRYFSSIEEYEDFCLTSDLIAKKWVRELVLRSGLI